MVPLSLLSLDRSGQACPLNHGRNLVILLLRGRLANDHMALTSQGSGATELPGQSGKEDRHTQTWRPHLTASAGC